MKLDRTNRDSRVLFFSSPLDKLPGMLPEILHPKAKKCLRVASVPSISRLPSSRGLLYIDNNESHDSGAVEAGNSPRVAYLKTTPSELRC